MASKQSVGKYQKKEHSKHPGIHAKSKMSPNKGAQQYKKQYRGQGR